MRRNKLFSVLGLMGFLSMLVFAQPTFAWDVNIFGTGHPSVNPASPAQGYLDGVSYPPSRNEPAVGLDQPAEFQCIREIYRADLV